MRRQGIEPGRPWIRVRATEEDRLRMQRELENGLKLVEGVVERAKEDVTLVPYARIDERAIASMREKLETASYDRLREFMLWLFQLATHWQIRMRGSDRSLNKVFELKVRYAGRL